MNQRTKTSGSIPPTGGGWSGKCTIYSPPLVTLWLDRLISKMQNHQHVRWQIHEVRDGNKRTAERVGHALGQRSELVNRVPVQQMQGRRSVTGIRRNYRGRCLGAPFSRQLSAAQVIHKVTRVTELGLFIITTQIPLSWGWLVTVTLRCQMCQQQRTPQPY